MVLSQAGQNSRVKRVRKEIRKSDCFSGSLVDEGMEGIRAWQLLALWEACSVCMLTVVLLGHQVCCLAPAAQREGEADVSLASDLACKGPGRKNTFSCYHIIT